MHITKNQLRKIIREVLDEEENIGVKVSTKKRINPRRIQQ